MSINTVEKIDDFVPVKHVLISVSDKSSLDKFIPALLQSNPRVMIYSTGGTYAVIEKILGSKAKKRLIQVSDYTGQPEMQGGLVKTLDFKIYLGLLSETYNPAHKADLKRTGGVAFDMVVVNLYPFTATIAQKDVTAEAARGNIDIGGPCMVRASAKNFIRVASVVDPRDYLKINKELQENKGRLSLVLRYTLAKKAFAHTAKYDAAIADFLAKTTPAKIRKCYSLAKGK